MKFNFKTENNNSAYLLVYYKKEKYFWSISITKMFSIIKRFVLPINYNTE